MPGVYETWAECEAQVKGVFGAKFKSFPSEEAAQAAFRLPHEQFVGIGETPSVTALPDDVIKESVAVDAACKDNPGPLEYRGVDLQTGKVLFRQGPFADGTVNIGEFLAIVHALALLQKRGLSIPVYSDSETAIGWVKRGKANTKLKMTAANAPLFELVARAEKWLAENRFSNPIIKWNTAQWGDIPADYARK